jgi:hypothetical protein
MAVVGYARVSTEEQELTAQLEQLRAAGVEKVFQEKASGVREDRPELGRMLEYVREGDAVVVCKLDRIAHVQHPAKSRSYNPRSGKSPMMSAARLMAGILSNLSLGPFSIVSSAKTSPNYIEAG